MNSKEQWKSFGEDEDADLSALLNMKSITKHISTDPMMKIKRNLLINSILGILISAGYIFLLIRFPFWQLLLCIGIVLIFTVWAVVKAFLLYNNMEKTLPGNTVLQEMERHYASMENWMTVQQKVGLLIYPVSAAGGFMLGGSLGAGKSIDIIMQKPLMIIALLIAVAILVPLCFYLARWMCKVAFVKYTEQLKRNIETLKSEI